MKSVPLFFRTKMGEDGCLTVEFVGPISGEVPLEINHSKCKRLVLDLKEVEYVTSIGIVHFMRWIETTKGLPVSIVKCPEVFVKSLNLIKTLITENCRVESFYLPYYCEQCDYRGSLLLQEKVEFSYAKVGGEPTVDTSHEMICRDCKKSMVLDVDPDQYFRFLREPRG